MRLRTQRPWIALAILVALCHVSLGARPSPAVSMGIPNPPEQPTTIYAQITFRHISELSAQSQTIYADFWIQLAWVDPSVNYSEPFDSTRHFFPSITLPTARRSDAYQEPAWQIAYGYPSFPAPPPGAPGPSAMWVSASGTAAGVMANRMRVYDWPQDVQSVGVEIELLSWTVEYARFEMWPGASSFIYDPDFAVSEWRLKGGHIESYDHYYRNLDRTVDRVKATVVLQRESSWFMNKAVLNVVLLVLLALMAASMRPMTPDRFAIAISVFMAIVSWVFVLSADSPRTGENTRMDSFINVSFATVFLLAGFSALNYLWKEFATKQASKRKLLQSPAAMSALDALTGLSRRFPPGPGGGGSGAGSSSSSHTPAPLSSAPSQVWAAGAAHAPHGASRLQQQHQPHPYHPYGSGLTGEAAGSTPGSDAFSAASSGARASRGAKRLTLSSLAAAAAVHAAAAGSAGSSGAATGGGSGRRTVRGSLVAPPLTSIAQLQALQGHPHTPTQAQQAQAIATGNPLAALPPGAAPRPSPTAGGSGGSGFSGCGGLSASPAAAAGHASLTRNTSFAARAAFPATQPSRRGDGRAGSGSKGCALGPAAAAAAAGASGRMLPLPEGCGGSVDTPSSPYRAPQQPQQRGSKEIELPPLTLPPPGALPRHGSASAAAGGVSGTGAAAAPASGGGADDAHADTVPVTHVAGGLRPSHIEAALANLAAVAAGAADGYGDGEGEAEAPGSPDFGDGGTGDDGEELQAELRSRHAAQVRAAAAAALSALRASIAAGGVGGGASFANPLASPPRSAGGHAASHGGDGAANVSSFSDDEGGEGDSHGRSHSHSPALLQDGGRADAGTAAAAAAGTTRADRRAASLPPVRVEILGGARSGAAGSHSSAGGGGGEAAGGKRGRGDSSVAAVNPLHAAADPGPGSAGGTRASRGGGRPAGSRDGADAAAASPLRCGASCCATVAVRMWEVFCFMLWFLLACGWCCPRRYNGGRGPPSFLCCSATRGAHGTLRGQRGGAGRRSAADGGSRGSRSDGEEEDGYVEPLGDDNWGAALHSGSSRNIAAARGYAGSSGVAAAAAGGADAAALASEGYPYDENGDPVLRSMWSFRTDAGPLVAATPGAATPRGSAAASMTAPLAPAAGPTAAAARWQRLRAAGLGAPALTADGRRSGSAASAALERRMSGGGGLRRKESFVARALTEEVRCCGVHLSFLEEFKPRMLDKRVTLLVLLLYSSATALIFLRPVRVSTLE